jgi:two-component system, NarL family, nitrate/nitrite response regulator NarL
MVDEAGQQRVIAEKRDLSPRERQVLEMATRGLTNAQIAAHLNISVHAVKFHLSSVYRKLGVSNRTGAAVRYMQQRKRGRA